jgi:hypothetical protein
MRLVRYSSNLPAVMMGMALAGAIAAGGLLLGSRVSHAADKPPSAWDTCILFPAKGVHVINDHALVFIDREDKVGLVELTSSCLAQKANQISVSLSSRAEAICSRKDFYAVIDQAIGNNLNEGCAISAFEVIGHMGKDGYIVYNDKAKALLDAGQQSSLNGEVQSSGQSSSK